MKRWFRFTIAGTAFFVAACSVSQTSNSLIKSLPVTVLFANQVCGPAANVAGLTWIQTQDKLIETTTKLQGNMLGGSSPDLKVDFDNSNALLISMGQKPSGGYAVSLRESTANVKRGTAQIAIDWVEPIPGVFTTQMLTSPCLLVSLPKGDYQKLEVVDQYNKTHFEQGVP